MNKIDIIYTYTCDMTRPNCPRCGAIVDQTTDTPEIAWQGVCQYGHVAMFELDLEEC